MSTDTLRTAWDAIPSLVKIGGSLATGFAMAVFALSAAMDIPARVAATEIVTAQHTTELRELDRRVGFADRRAEYTICLLEHLSGEGRRTPSQCAADYARGIP